MSRAPVQDPCDSTNPWHSDLVRGQLPLQDARLTKQQRYGHPCERTIHSSVIPPATFLALVQSFLEFGLQVR